MFRVALLVSLFVTSGCAVKPSANTELYEMYVQLSNSVNSNNIATDKEKFFSTTYLSEVIDDDEKSLFLLKIPSYIKTVDSHFQKFNYEQGCLTVNGFEENSEPVSIFVEYKKEFNRWRVNYMYLNMIENKREFVNKAVCPNEVELN